MLAIFFIALALFILLLLYPCLAVASRADDEMDKKFKDKK